MFSWVFHLAKKSISFKVVNNDHEHCQKIVVIVQLQKHHHIPLLKSTKVGAQECVEDNNFASFSTMKIKDMMLQFQTLLGPSLAT